MFSGRKKTPRGMSSRTPRGTFNRRTPVGSSIGNRGGASSTTKKNNNNINNNSMQRRMNYSAKFSNNNNSEYVSPAKKARTDFFQSRPSTLRMQQRTSSSPIVDANSVFKVLVNDFPPEVTQALDKTASVGGTNDGVFSWAIKGGQLHVWNNLTKQIIHNDVNLPSLPPGLQHPANLIVSTRKNVDLIVDLSTATPGNPRNAANYTLLVVSPLGIIRFHENINSVNYVQGRLDLFDDELVVDITHVPAVNNAFFYVCSTSQGRLFNILKPKNIVQIMTALVSNSNSNSKVSSMGTDDAEGGGLLSAVAGWIGWGGDGNEKGNTQDGNDNESEQNDTLVNGSKNIASSFVNRMDNHILHLTHTIDDNKKSAIKLTHLNIARDGESGATFESTTDVTDLLFDKVNEKDDNVDDDVNMDDEEEEEVREDYVQISNSQSAIIQASCIPSHRRLIALIARPIRKGEENTTSSTSANVYVYELIEFEIALNRNIPLQPLRKCPLFQYPSLEEEGIYCITSGNSNTKKDSIVRTYLVSELGSLGTNLLNVFEVSWELRTPNKPTTTRTISTKAVLYKNFLGVLQGSDGPIFISKERDFGMFTTEGSYIFPDDSADYSRSRSPVTNLTDAVATSGMSDTYDLEGAARLLRGGIDMLLQNNDGEGLKNKIQLWLRSGSSSSSVNNNNDTTDGDGNFGDDIIEIFGKAVVSTSTSIVDQEVGSGNQWADTSDGLQNQFSAAGHKLVRQFLEEKLKRHRALSYLLGLNNTTTSRSPDKKFDVKYLNIPQTLPRECAVVETHGLFLNAAISMLAYQEGLGSDNNRYGTSPASDAIIQTVRKDRGWTREKLQGLGLVAADVFYSAPRRVLQVLPHMLRSIQSIGNESNRENNETTSYLPAMNEAVAVTHILISKLQSTVSLITNGKEIVFSVGTRQALESLLLEAINIIQTSHSAQQQQNNKNGNIIMPKDALATKDIESLKDMIMNCVECFLNILNTMKQLTTASTTSATMSTSTTTNVSGTGTRDIDIQFKRIIEKIVYPLLEYGGMMLKRSIILADTYFHHELLAKVCEKEEQLEGRDTGRLQQYMNNPRLKDEGFTDFIYARMLKQRKVGRVLNQPAERNDDLKEYLSKHPKLSWVHAIRSRRYIAACDALHHTAEAPLHSGLDVKLDEHGKRNTQFSESFGTQKMLYSIAKLSLFAGTRANDKTPENVEYTKKMEDLNANLIITTAHETILEISSELAKSGDNLSSNTPRKDEADDATKAKLENGERLLPTELTAFYIKTIKELLLRSPEHHIPQVIALTKLVIEYIWQTQVSRSEQLNDSLRDTLLGQVWMEIIRFDIVLIRQLSGLREKSGGLNDVGLEGEIKTKSLTYRIIHNMAVLNLDPQNFLNGSLIENEIRKNDSVTIRDLRMISSIVDLGTSTASKEKEEA